MAERSRSTRRKGRDSSLYEKMSAKPKGRAELAAAKFTTEVDGLLLAIFNSNESLDVASEVLEVSREYLEEILNSQGVISTSVLAKLACVCGYSPSLTLEKMDEGGADAHGIKKLASVFPEYSTNKFRQSFIHSSGVYNHDYEVANLPKSSTPVGPPEELKDHALADTEAKERSVSYLRKFEQEERVPS